MAVIGWILLGIVALILLVFIVPVRVLIDYRQHWDCRLLLFGFVPVFAWRSDGDKSPRPAKPAAKPAAKKKENPSLLQEFKALYREEGLSGVLAFFGQLARVVGRLVRGVTRAITVRRLELSIRVGGEEADEIAVLYGRVNAALYPSLTALSHVLRFRRKTVCVVPDFTATDTTAALSMTVWVWPIRVVGAGLAALCRFIAAWVRHMPSGPAASSSDKQSASVS